MRAASPGGTPVERGDMSRQVNETSLTRNEFRSTAAIAMIYATRLLGLFMIYPVFAHFAHSLARRHASDDRLRPRRLWIDARSVADTVRTALGSPRPTDHGGLRSRGVLHWQPRRRPVGVDLGRCPGPRATVRRRHRFGAAGLGRGCNTARDAHPGHGHRRCLDRLFVHGRGRARPCNRGFRRLVRHLLAHRSPGACRYRHLRCRHPDAGDA
jgi:hypothetical protein